MHRCGSRLVVGLLGRDLLRHGLLLLLLSSIVCSRVGVDGCRLLGRRSHGVGGNGLLGIVLLLLLLGGDGILSSVGLSLSVGGSLGLGLLFIVRVLDGDGSHRLHGDDATSRGNAASGSGLLGVEIGRGGRGRGRLAGDRVETVAAVGVEGEAVDGSGGNVEEAARC